MSFATPYPKPIKMERIPENIHPTSARTPPRRQPRVTKKHKFGLLALNDPESSQVKGDSTPRQWKKAKDSWDLRVVGGSARFVPLSNEVSIVKVDRCPLWIQFTDEA